MEEIDCLGMACHQPVVTARKALDESRGREFIIIIDNLAARDNVERFPQSQGAVSEKGVEILSCGTCLDFYGLKEKLEVGIVSNMYDITLSLLEADRLIRP